jgi:hypothetical protein
MGLVHVLHNSLALKSVNEMCGRLLSSVESRPTLTGEVKISCKGGIFLTGRLVEGQ